MRKDKKENETDLKNTRTQTRCVSTSSVIQSNVHFLRVCVCGKRFFGERIQEIG